MRKRTRFVDATHVHIVALLEPNDLFEGSSGADHQDQQERIPVRF